MQESTTREKVLKRIRQALIHKTNPQFPVIDWEKNVYSEGQADSLEEQFAEAFQKIGGRFVYCENELDFAEQLVTLASDSGWKQIHCTEPWLTELFDRVDFPYVRETNEYPEEMVGITGCEALVARLGSILVSSRQGSGRRLFVAPTIHIIVARTHDLVRDLSEALARMKAKYGEQFPSFVASLAGPSRTADIEKTLVSPAHGPRDIYVFLIDTNEA